MGEDRTLMAPAPGSDVEAAFLAYPEQARVRLYELRELVLETAAALEEVGPLSETLKWGEPAYLTDATGSGSTIRLGWKKNTPTRYAMYFNCQTTLVDTFRTLFPELTFEGNRAVIFDVAEPLPREAAIKCIELALTYHAAQKKRRRRRA